jgi:hypothetical protein
MIRSAFAESTAAPCRRGGFVFVAISFADDLGGQDRLSEPAKILVRQAAALTVQIEALQSKIVAGEDVDTEQLVRISNVLSRTLARLGLKKPAPPRPPTLAEVLRSAS